MPVPRHNWCGKFLPISAHFCPFLDRMCLCGRFQVSNLFVNPIEEENVQVDVEAGAIPMEES